jgi:hypothetical protein
VANFFYKNNFYSLLKNFYKVSVYLGTWAPGTLWGLVPQWFAAGALKNSWAPAGHPLGTR